MRKFTVNILLGFTIICCFSGNLFAQSKVESNKALVAKQQSIVPIAAYAATGELIGMPLIGPQRGYAAFAPVIEIFLKEHLFADIFERDILTFAERELVTISVLSSIGGVEPMLRSHLSICLNLGFTPEQLNEFVGIIQSTVGEKEGSDAQTVLDEVLENRPA
ncbi:MAG: carboxymuconolactone decarboxylase family protein [Planctomycetota bacterium]|jgi:alkylhydroperoxidase/carboxymuconolactone decarboxylase family protein YurZ